MGYQSTFIVLNDSASLVRDDPSFGEKVYEKIIGFWRQKEIDRDISVAGHCNAATIVAQDHADTYRCLIIGGNTAHDLGVVGFWSPMVREMNEEERKEFWLRDLANQMGFRLVKKNKKT